MTELIWKFDLHEGFNKLGMPRGAKILCVDKQIDGGKLWALVNPDAPATARTIFVIGTGVPFPQKIVAMPNSLRVYLGTWQEQTAARGVVLVWHAFDLGGNFNDRIAQYHGKDK